MKYIIQSIKTISFILILGLGIQLAHAQPPVHGPTTVPYSAFNTRLQEYVNTNPNEAQKGIIDVTLSPYSAAGDGNTDDTQALQNAIDDAYDNNFAVYLPAGKIFLVSQQLKLITVTESRRYGHQLLGDANGNKPIIRLIDGSGIGGANNYDDALIRFQYDNGQGGTEPAKHYTATFRNIDIDMGNNPAATALTMAGAQHCVIEDIKIYGEAFNVGIKDLPGSGGGSVNVHIIGGNIGIHQDQNRSCPTLIGLVLEEQKDYGIKLTNTQGPLVIAGFKISSTQALSANYNGIYLNNKNFNETVIGEITVVDHSLADLCLTDGSIEVSGVNGVGIRNGRQDLSLVNVYIKANKLIENGVHTAPYSFIQGDENQWKKISQHYYTSILDQSSVVIDGQSLNDRTNSYESTGTITDETPDESIYSKHSYGEIPDFNNPNLVDITTYGATTANQNPDDDDALAIQSAIDDVSNPESANYGKTVLIPRGNFGIDNPIVVKKGVKLIGTAKNISTIYANNPWKNENGAIITTVDDANGEIILSDFSIMGYPRMCYLRVQSGNSVVRDIMTEDKIAWGWPGTTDDWKRVNPRVATYLDFTMNAGGKVYQVCTGQLTKHDRWNPSPNEPDYHHVSIKNTSNPLAFYQISVEHHVFSPKVLVEDASNLTIFGFKYEGPAELLHIINSDNIKICGGNGNYYMDREGDQAIINISNSTNILLRNMARKTLHGRYIFGRDYPVNDITKFWVLDSETEVSPYHAILWYKKDSDTPAATNDEIQKNNEIQVYPNPIDDFVYVSLSNQAAQCQYRILDLSGRLMQQGFLKRNQINCSSLRPGVYVLNISSESGSYSIKVVKN
ncbi:glycosyl hydrolase family 28-related protein [Carboxylicivirga marina]|uniref:T9SS type A sorting domain-containing protein n=1 Tax=Carboxylicivirga marina TaxID=2800988 RepID=A0ABS1HEJ7_9BACT|nr:glycosyl hydrolase family 28-related protein [Carboxylicivirga marina]MBK3516100.1 T9SS type A sorting domain-containing protein [Carboxylicivirga marina]